MTDSIDKDEPKNKAVGPTPETALDKTDHKGNSNTLNDDGSPKYRKPKKLNKQQTMLLVMYRKSVNGLNCFEALPHGDTVLHSTVPILEKSYRISIYRERENVIRPNGNKANVCRYWLVGENRSRARELLKRWHVKV